jgi:uncharacterized protein YrrD
MLVMLKLNGALVNQPVMSLRTGTAIATAVAPIFNPNNLKIEGFYCQSDLSKGKLILLSQEIRDIIPQGLVVNDHEALTEPDELVRLKEILDINFQLIGKPVITVNKEKLGKVADYAADSQSLYVQKLYVARSLLKSLSTGQLSIDRNHIVEITSRKIIVQEILKPTKGSLPVTAPMT